LQYSIDSVQLSDPMVSHQNITYLFLNAPSLYVLAVEVLRKNVVLAAEHLVSITHNYVLVAHYCVIGTHKYVVIAFKFLTEFFELGVHEFSGSFDFC